MHKAIITSQLQILDLYNKYKTENINPTLQGFKYYLRDELNLKSITSLFNHNGHYEKFTTIIKIIKEELD